MGILIIDSSGVQAGIISSVMRRGGYEDAIAADSIAGGLERLTRPGDVDLIVLDIDTLEMEPLEAYRKIRALEGATDKPIVMLCQPRALGMLSPAFNNGPADCLLKPLDEVEVLTRLKTGLRLAAETERRKKYELKTAEARRKITDIGHRLRRVTSLDETTGIANRRFFDATYRKEWLRAAREERPLAVILIRVLIPDGVGSGDKGRTSRTFLKEVAVALSNTAKRPGDLVARFDDYEFAVLLPSTPLSGAVVVAEKMLAKVHAIRSRYGTRLDPAEAGVYFGVSAGVPRVGEDMDTLLLRAREALI